MLLDTNCLPDVDSFHFAMLQKKLMSDAHNYLCIYYDT